jgi:hypothetical protein
MDTPDEELYWWKEVVGIMKARGAKLPEYYDTLLASAG